MRKLRFIFFIIAGITFLALSIWLAVRIFSPTAHFNSERAYQDVLKQVNFGPRTPGSEAHSETAAYIQMVLEQNGWVVTIQNTTWMGFPIVNIIASRASTETPIIIAAHYDSRIRADQDKGASANLPVPGANDGASGVAILLELARTLPREIAPIRLVFFDAEDDGGLDNMQWIMGSKAYVASLTEKPRAAIILDMVGDSDLNIYIEQNSDPILTASIWAEASAIGYGKYFISRPKYDMVDDHTPFLEAGIPAVDIIDFDYPYWHTLSDTPDKVSAKSLQAVGETLWQWITRQK